MGAKTKTTKVLDKVYILYDGEKRWWFQREMETEMPDLKTYAEQIKKSLRNSVWDIIVADNYIAWKTWHFAVAHVIGEEPDAIYGVPFSEDKVGCNFISLVMKEQNTVTKEEQKIEQLSFF